MVGTMHVLLLSFSCSCGTNLIASMQVGNRKLLEDEGVVISSETEAHLLDIEQKARSEVLVAIDGLLEGVFGIADPLKREAAVVVEALRRMGISSIMVTGDNWTTARAIAKEVCPSLFKISLYASHIHQWTFFCVVKT